MQALLNWIESHPGLAGYLQAIFSVLAILVAAWVPWRIHQREITEQRSVRQEYVRLLTGALENLKGSTEELVRVQRAYPVDLPPEERPDAKEFGKTLVSTMHAMIEANGVLQTFSDVSRVNSVKAVNEVLKLRRMLDAILPIIEHEISILQGAMTPGTIRVNVDRLLILTEKLIPQLDTTIGELS
jgi:hypothetical protein